MKAATLAIAALAACANGDAEPRPSATKPDPAHRATEESHVFEVKSSDDLGRLSTQYMAMWSSGFTGRLEVKVAPGAELQATGWGLEPEHPGTGEPRIDVVITGNGGVLPMPGRIFAHSLELDDVVLTGPRGGAAELRVTTGFTMRRSMLVDARLTDPNWTGGFIEVYADGGPRVGASVLIEDCWFVRNFQTDKPAKMLWLTQRGEDAGFFDKVQVARSAFLGNAFAADLAVQYARGVSIEGSLFFRNWSGPGSEISCSNCEAVVVSGSTFAVDSADQVAAVERTQPVLLKGSRVLVRGWKRGAAPPAALDSSAADLIADSAGFAGTAAASEAITAAAGQLRVPGRDAFAKLARAFGG